MPLGAAGPDMPASCSAKLTLRWSGWSGLWASILTITNWQTANDRPKGLQLYQLP